MIRYYWGLANTRGEEERAEEGGGGGLAGEVGVWFLR
jgi:hypothetical protein